MRTIVFGLLLATTLICTIGCDSRKDENVVMFKDDDAGMATAIAQSRQTVDTFISRLSKPATPDDFITVKFALPTTDGSLEHIWCENVQFAADTFTATIANDPLDKQYKFGQQVSARKNEISDWMYVQDGKLVGGYTIRYAYSKMPPDEQRTFRENVPFQLD